MPSWSGTSSARSATISRATRPRRLPPAPSDAQPTGSRCRTADFVARVGDPYWSGRVGESEGGGGFPYLAAGSGAASRRSFGVPRFGGGSRRERELGEVKAVAREDLVALADDVVGLDEQVEAHPDAKAAYLRGMEAYQRADDAFDRARSPGDLARVSAAIADSRYDMETAKALTARQRRRRSGGRRASSTLATAPRSRT